MAQPFPTSTSSSSATHQPIPIMKNSTSEKDIARHDHPYLIRTTSSSLLTRSNSIGSVHKPSMHTAIGPSSPALGRSQGRGHKKTKSHSAVPPSLPLPPLTPKTPERQELLMMPPLSPSPARSPNPGNVRLRLRRSDTLPSMPTRVPDSPTKLDDLPPNPKLWTSTNLAFYLSSALRIKGGGALPLPVIRDVATFVVNQKLSGRVFLRLTDSDLEDMGMNQLWRPALLNASRALRQNVVQGRIWGFGSTVPEEEGEEEEEDYNRNAIARRRSKHKSLPASITEPFKLVLDTIAEPDSAHSDDETGGGWGHRDINISLSRKRAGKVKGLVANYERSASSCSGSSMADDEDCDIGFALSPSGGSDRSPGALSPCPSEQDLRSPSEGEVLHMDDATQALGLTHALDREDVDEVQDGADVEQSSVVLPPRQTPGPSTGTIIAPIEDHTPSVPSSPAIPPQTPPPSYSAAGDDNTPPGPLNSQAQQTPTRHSTPSQTIILSATSSARRRKNLSYIAEVTFENAPDSNDGEGREQGEEEQTISELLANIDPSGANAWLEQDGNGGNETTNAARRSTAKKVFESVRSISRKANQLPSLISPGTSPTRSKGSVAAASGGRASVIGLFDPIPAPVSARTMADVAISTDDEYELDSPVVVPDAAVEDNARQELLLEEFRTRLEEVERRLEEMELRDTEREREREEVAQRLKEFEQSTNTASLQSSPGIDDVDESAFSSFGSLSLSSTTGSNHVVPMRTKDTDVTVVGDDLIEDPSLTGLPSYVLLVGLGVCSVVMRVVFKRIVGRVL
ncbi:hypothetical protein FRB93_000365 [Tulasnella sp. JGI-2019a]|nr:hypothetical protein FRB93_000365 [Tulasnella sp. JGI-2019a]